MDALAALRLQLEWGADEALLAEPVSRLDRGPPPMRPPPALASAAAAVPAAAPARALSGADPHATAAAAGGCASVAELSAALAASGGLGLAATATSFAWMAGNPAARLVCVAEAPDDREEASGIAFSGPAAALLGRMLGSIGVERDAVLLANLVPWRPPGGRAPSPAEIAACLPFLLRLLELVQPRHAVCLGAAAARALLKRSDPVSRLRGRWAEVALAGSEAPLKVLPMLHPGQLIARPEQKAQAWADLRMLRRSLAAFNDS